jgi:flagellar biogenesis protein FliO
MQQSQWNLPSRFAAIALVAGHATADAPEVPSFGASLGKTALALGALLILLALAARLLPRWLSNRVSVGKARELEVLETCRLDGRRTLYLVRVLSRPWIVSVSEQGTSLQPLEPAPDFQTRLDRSVGEPVVRR